MPCNLLRHTTLLLLFISSFLVAKNPKSINPIIGDQSYFMKYGVLPNDQTNDHDRIQTHLAYAEFLMRTTDVSHLSPEENTKRNHTLDLLHEYWTRGQFPMNADYASERQPCFIDDNGTICAVGYLVEQTAGRNVAELISERHLYQTILEMKDPILDEWVQSSGLTLEECAIIQPSYDFMADKTWHLSYGVSYRIDDNLYHTFELFRKRNRGRSSFYSLFGVRFDWLRHNDFSAGLKYSTPFRLRRKQKGDLSICTEAFCFNATWGMNLRPGYELRKDWDSGLSLGLSYSYAIPVIKENTYEAGRHDFTVRVAMNLNEIHIKIPKKPKQEVDQLPDA